MGKELLKRIDIDPKVMMGKPVIKGTRITVEIILRKLAEEISIDEILNDYPRLTKEDIQASILYAAESLSSEEIGAITGTRT